MNSGIVVIQPEPCMLHATMDVSVTSDSTDSDYSVLVSACGNATEHWCFIESINIDVT